MARGGSRSADQLLEDVWSGESIPARNNLQVHVSRLRRALGEERIATRGGGYALELSEDALDAARFERLVSEGRAALQAGAAADAAEAFRNALALWRGAPLVDFADDDFAGMLRKMGTGLLVTELMGQGVNYVTGDYSRGASGYWVENGVIQYPVEEITIAGNMKTMFRQIAGIGTDTLVRGTRRSGSILIENMTVAGS